MFSPQHRSTLASHLAPLMAAALASGSSLETDAQHDSEQCVIKTDPACVDVLISRITKSQVAMPNASDVAMSQMQLAFVLARYQRLNEAEAVIDSIAPTLPDSKIKDLAIANVIDQLDENSIPRATRLISQVNDPYYYEMARAHYVSILAKTNDLDVAVGAVDATNRANQPIHESGLIPLVKALLADGRLETAWAVVDDHAADAARWPALDVIVKDRLAAWEFDAARTTVSRMGESPWRAISTARLALALAQYGKAAEAKDAFAQARHLLGQISDMDSQREALQGFAEAAIDAGEVDLTLLTAQDVARDPIDHVSTLLQVADLLVNNPNPGTRIKWRSVIDAAIARLESVPARGDEFDDLINDRWNEISSVVEQGGEPQRAADLLERIADQPRREQALQSLVHYLSATGQLQPALQILSHQSDGDRRVQGYLRVAKKAISTGDRDSEKQATREAIGLIEGPNHIEVSDETILLLAQLEAEAGDFEIASRRLRFTRGMDLQARGRILLMKHTRNSSAEQYAKYLMQARDAIENVENPLKRQSLLELLTGILIEGGKCADAIGIVREVADPANREQLNRSISMRFLVTNRLGMAYTTAGEISDPSQRRGRQVLVLLAALERSLIENARSDLIKPAEARP